MRSSNQVKKSSRRNLLAKLGTGAAAATVLSVAGAPNTAHAGNAAPTKKGTTTLVNPKSVKKLTVKGKKLQIVVSMNKDVKKGLSVSASPNSRPRIGVNKGALHLGVSITDGTVSITGLDSVLQNNVGGGRCVISDNEVGFKG